MYLYTIGPWWTFECILADNGGAGGGEAVTSKRQYNKDYSVIGRSGGLYKHLNWRCCTFEVTFIALTESRPQQNVTLDGCD